MLMTVPNFVLQVGVRLAKLAGYNVTNASTPPPTWGPVCESIWRRRVSHGDPLWRQREVEYPEKGGGPPEAAQLERGGNAERVPLIWLLVGLKDALQYLRSLISELGLQLLIGL